jgi:heterodisulfide reductase subunit C2
MTKIDREFAEQFENAEDFNASACMNCGTCTGLCPIGLDVLPRRLFRYVLLGMEEKVRENIEPVFSCLLCGYCEENCPSGVKITDNIKSVRNYFNRKVHKL